MKTTKKNIIKEKFAHLYPQLRMKQGKKKDCVCFPKIKTENRKQKLRLFYFCHLFSYLGCFFV